MKTLKKLSALVLALMMAFTTLVVPAMAAGNDDEGIMPLYSEVRCPECGEYSRVVTSKSTKSDEVEQCSKLHMHHLHVTTITTHKYVECGHSTTFTSSPVCTPAW